MAIRRHVHTHGIRKQCEAIQCIEKPVGSNEETRNSRTTQRRRDAKQKGNAGSKHMQHQSIRNHHRENLWGIGNAKISFVAEMLAPSNTDIICIDRHILKAFGQDPESAPKPDDYHYMENIWNDLSRYSYCPPAIARFIYWDIHIQQKSNSRYWSKTLETS